MALVAQAGSVTRDKWSDGRLPAGDLRFDTLLKEIDPFGSKTMTVLVRPKLSGSLGIPYEEVSLSKHDMIFYFANLDGSSFIQSTVGQLVGSQEVAIYLKSNGRPYPFDSYQAHWRVFTIDTALSTPLPSLEIVDKTDWVGGFDVRVKQGSAPLEDKSTAIFSRDIVWDIKRSVSDKLAVLLLGLLMLVGALSSIMVTTAILQRRRPPSLAALGWLAAFLFALFEVRAALPGNPPSGNAFDRYLFFPVLLVLTVSTVLLLRAWLRRHDWDMENPIRPADKQEPDELRQGNASV